MRLPVLRDLRASLTNIVFLYVGVWAGSGTDNHWALGTAACVWVVTVAMGFRIRALERASQ